MRPALLLHRQEAQWERWRVAAQREGLSVSAWLRLIADTHAELSAGGLTLAELRAELLPGQPLDNAQVPAVASPP